jgi:NTP pyrophosphatase (non-canonical NTP hydrolase)
MHIHEFQNMMKHIYFQRDSKRGIKGTFDWLVEEIEELGAALKGNDKKALEDEFADVFAWLASLANVVDIDLDNIATLKYDSMCPKCQKTPCKCPFSK